MRQRFDDRDDPTDSKDYKITADALTLSSLFGYKLSKTWALSAYAEYRTSMFDGKLNDPGFLDLGAGATWTPITDLVVIIHPLNYNFVFSDSGFDYKSSVGCKWWQIIRSRDYERHRLKIQSSLFMSYQGSDLSNWTWTNGLTTAVKGFGKRFPTLALRGNKQEALAAGLTDNPLQTYWVLGLTYALNAKDPNHTNHERHLGICFLAFVCAGSYINAQPFYFGADLSYVNEMEKLRSRIQSR